MVRGTGRADPMGAAPLAAVTAPVGKPWTSGLRCPAEHSAVGLPTACPPAPWTAAPGTEPCWGLRGAPVHTAAAGAASRTREALPFRRGEERFAQPIRALGRAAPRHAAASLTGRPLHSSRTTMTSRSNAARRGGTDERRTTTERTQQVTRPRPPRGSMLVNRGGGSMLVNAGTQRSWMFFPPDQHITQSFLRYLLPVLPVLRSGVARRSGHRGPLSIRARKSRIGPRTCADRWSGMK